MDEIMDFVEKAVMPVLRFCGYQFFGPSCKFDLGRWQMAKKLCLDDRLENIMDWIFGKAS